LFGADLLIKNKKGESALELVKTIKSKKGQRILQLIEERMSERCQDIVPPKTPRIESESYLSNSTTKSLNSDPSHPKTPPLAPQKPPNNMKKDGGMISEVRRRRIIDPSLQVDPSRSEVMDAEEVERLVVEEQDKPEV